MSTSLWRQVRNAYRVGLKRYAWQIATIGDAKSGDLVGVDDRGNKFYETTNPEEIHLRTRWVEYPTWDINVAHLEPGWHYWLAYGTDTPPNKLKPGEISERAYPLKVHDTSYTGTPGAFVTYNTARPKFESWKPEVAKR